MMSTGPRIAETGVRKDGTIPPLKDQQIKDGCYQAAHCATVVWREGWIRGFVTEWEKEWKRRKKPGYSVDEHFKSKQEDGWKRGEEDGKRDKDPNNKWCSRYPYREGEGSDCEKNISPFRMAWRLGWYRGYCGGNAGDVHIFSKLGRGSRSGSRAAKRYFTKFLNLTATA